MLSSNTCIYSGVNPYPLKRSADILLSVIGLLLVSPLFLIIALFVKLDSKGPVFYCQQRIGKGQIPFALLKFRTMFIGSDREGLLTVGTRDSRVTSVGYYLRKYKLDELPQLMNVLKGEMSMVGPRPEVKRYTDLYTAEQLQVFSVRPGITDPASILFRSENDLLEHAEDPESFYIQNIIPVKLALNLDYIRHRSFAKDLHIIWETFCALFHRM